MDPPEAEGLFRRSSCWSSRKNNILVLALCASVIPALIFHYNQVVCSAWWWWLVLSSEDRNPGQNYTGVELFVFIFRMLISWGMVVATDLNTNHMILRNKVHSSWQMVVNTKSSFRKGSIFLLMMLNCHLKLHEQNWVHTTSSLLLPQSSPKTSTTTQPRDLMNVLTRSKSTTCG